MEDCHSLVDGEPTLTATPPKRHAGPGTLVADGQAVFHLSSTVWGLSEGLAGPPFLEV